MLARPRLGALGLRGRIVGAVLVTAVAALAVAAVALLGPLENSLRNADLTTLRREVPESATASFRRLDPFLALNHGITPQQKPAAALRSGKDIHVPPAPEPAQRHRDRRRRCTTRLRSCTTGSSAPSEPWGRRSVRRRSPLLGYPEPSGHASRNRRGGTRRGPLASRFLRRRRRGVPHRSRRTTHRGRSTAFSTRAPRSRSRRRA